MSASVYGQIFSMSFPSHALYSKVLQNVLLRIILLHVHSYAIRIHTSATECNLMCVCVCVPVCLSVLCVRACVHMCVHVVNPNGR